MFGKLLMKISEKMEKGYKKSLRKNSQLILKETI
jgi:hypothetical protein